MTTCGASGPAMCRRDSNAADYGAALKHNMGNYDAIGDPQRLRRTQPVCTRTHLAHQPDGHLSAPRRAGREHGRATCSCVLIHRLSSSRELQRRGIQPPLAFRGGHHDVRVGGRCGRWLWLCAAARGSQAEASLRSVLAIVLRRTRPVVAGAAVGCHALHLPQPASPPGAARCCRPVRKARGGSDRRRGEKPSRARCLCVSEPCGAQTSKQ